jgi:hypothetical protein
MNISRFFRSLPRFAITKHVKGKTESIATQPIKEHRSIPIPFQFNYNNFIGIEKPLPPQWNDSTLEMTRQPGLTKNVNYMVDSIQTGNMDEFYETFKLLLYAPQINDGFKIDNWFTPATVPYATYIIIFGLYKMSKFPDILNFWDNFKPLFKKHNHEIPQPIFRILFHTFYYHKNFYEFDKLFTLYCSKGFPMIVEVTNTTIRRYLFTGELDRIKFVLNMENVERDFQTDIILIKGYIKFNRYDEIVQFYQHFIKKYSGESVQVISHVWSAVLKYAFENDKLDVIPLVLQHIKEKGNAEFRIFVVLFTGFGRLKNRDKFDEALDLFQSFGIPLNEALCAGLFSAYLSFGDIKSVEKLQQQMDDQAITRTMMIRRLLFFGYIEQLEYGLSLTVYQEIDRLGLDVHHSHRRSLQNMFYQFCSRGLVLEMTTLMEILLRTKQFDPKMVSISLHTLYKAGSSTEHFQVVDLLEKYGFTLTLGNWHTMLRFFIKNHDPKNFKVVVGKMEARNFTSEDEVTHQLLVFGYTQLNLLDDMFKVATEQKVKKVEKNSKTEHKITE